MQSVGIPTDAEAVAAIDERVAVIREATETWRSRRAFLNFAERGVDPDAFYAPGVHRRLVALRAARDPDGIFRPKLRDRLSSGSGGSGAPAAPHSSAWATSSSASNR